MSGRKITHERRCPGSGRLAPIGGGWQERAASGRWVGRCLAATFCRQLKAM